MTNQEILKKVDHTLLKQTSTWEQIKVVCDDAIRFNTASVCIPPSFVAKAKREYGEKLNICTVIGFPNGYNTTAVKVFEAQQAIKDGANEIDMVVNLGWVQEGDYDSVLKEISQIRAATEGKILKVIVETCFLTQEQKIKLCEVVRRGLYQNKYGIRRRRSNQRRYRAVQSSYRQKRKDEGGRRNKKS